MRNLAPGPAPRRSGESDGGRRVRGERTPCPEAAGLILIAALPWRAYGSVAATSALHEIHRVGLALAFRPGPTHPLAGERCPTRQHRRTHSPASMPVTSFVTAVTFCGNSADSADSADSATGPSTPSPFHCSFGGVIVINVESSSPESAVSAVSAVSADVLSPADSAETVARGEASHCHCPAGPNPLSRRAAPTRRRAAYIVLSLQPRSRASASSAAAGRGPAASCARSHVRSAIPQARRPARRARAASLRGPFRD